jgi:hypothetical protein
MANEIFKTLKGHCTCKAVTYEVLAPFLCMNCCHCTYCQRETGSAFVLNGFIESSSFRVTSEIKPVFNNIPSASGNGQLMARCPECRIVLYSDYGGDGTLTTFVRAGTLDDEGKKTVKPEIHIYTETKLDWIDLTAEKERGVPVLLDGNYRPSEVWRKDALERFDVLKEKIQKARRGKKLAEKSKV